MISMLFAVIALALFFFFPATFSQGQDIDPDNSQAVNSSIGTILLARGNVVKLRKDVGEVVAGKEGKILVGDVLKTGKASLAKIRMYDDTIFSLGPESEVHFTKFMARSKEDRQSVYDFAKGQLRAHFPIKAAPGDIQIRSKTAAMGVRGTKLLANLRTDDNGRETIQYALVQGKIEIENLLTRKITVLDPGQHYIMRGRDESVEEEGVLEMSPEELKEFQATGLPEESERAPFLPYFWPTQVSGVQGRAVASRGPASLAEEKSRAVAQEGKKDPGWKKTLQELNSRLRKYQEKQ